MTSARAYRPGRPASVAVSELKRYAGTQFDPASVDALCAAIEISASQPEHQVEEPLSRAV